MESEPLSIKIGILYDLQTNYLEPRLRKLGIGWGTFQLLAAVQAAGKGASQAEIARRLGITPATLSEAVFANVKKGYLEQNVDESDRRVRTLALTPQAKSILRKVTGEFEACEKALVEGLSDKALVAANEAIDNAIKNLQQNLDFSESK